MCYLFFYLTLYAHTKIINTENKKKRRYNSPGITAKRNETDSVQ